MDEKEKKEESSGRGM